MTKTESIRLDLSVGGTSLLDTGVGSTKVLLHRYSDGVLIGSVAPNAVTGQWQYRLQNNDQLLVTHIGPSGFRPVSDGPVTPFAE